MNPKSILLGLLLVVTFFTSMAQKAVVSSVEKTAILKAVKEQLSANYYFQETIPATIQRIEASEKSGRYHTCQTLDCFFKAIEADIYAITKDKHIRISYQAPPASTSQGKIEVAAQYLQNPSYTNQGLQGVQVLPGNIGYLQLTRFGDLETDKSMLASAFNFVKNTNGLIIDLRKNGGGTYSRLLTSYLLPEDSLHLITYKWKDGNIDSIYTFKHLDGPRYLNRPVYVLTSDVTFSSAEEFTYDVQHLNRVTVVGDTTRGGANPGRRVPFYQFKDGASLVLFIPMGHVINSVTQANWEGIGVIPHQTVDPAKALLVAHLALVNQKINNATNKEEKRLLQWMADDIQADLSPITLNAEQTKKIAGSYGDYAIIAKGTKLFVEQKADHSQYELVPITADYFLTKELANTRYMIDTTNGKRQLNILYRDGRVEYYTLY